MQKIARLINLIAGNTWTNIGIGVIVLTDTAKSITADIKGDPLRSAHGVVLLGVWHVARALGDVFEGVDYLAVGATDPLIPAVRPNFSAIRLLN